MNTTRISLGVVVFFLAPLISQALTLSQAQAYVRQAKNGDTGAFTRLMSAAKKDDLYAELGVGAIYHFGYGVPKNEILALKWDRKAANKGVAIAQNNLGTVYDQQQNYKEAVKWYHRAAEQGFAAAQNNLGIEYMYGRGVQQDLKEAVKWWSKAADQGDADGQYNLGLAYYKGIGVQQNPQEAVKWWRKAAAQGDASAKNNLKILSEK